MGQSPDVEKVAGTPKSTRQSDVFRRRRRVPGGVVVGQDDGRGVGENRRL